MRDSDFPRLKTKLNIPSPPGNIIHRPRLIARMNEGLQHRLILISALAGSGKTTLLSEWARQIHLPVAWLSLDESDNDAVRFFWYLISSIQNYFIGPDADVSRFLQPSQPPDFEPILAGLLNEIMDRAIELVLILDDYHCIKNPAIHEAVKYLIEHRPEHLHLVLSTRADPPLPLSRLRGQGQLLELRASDLAFQVIEAQDLLSQTAAKTLTQQQAVLLEAKTEGWAAGLQLAGLAMRGRRDIDGFISSISGSHRFILDFLSEEVFRRQTTEMQDFLLRSCILDSMCASLCDSLLDTRSENQDSAPSPQSQNFLDTLEHSNLFVVALDDTRKWFRYHHLFLEMLRSQLIRTNPAASLNLNLKASLWYEEQGMVKEAIQHAFNANDDNRSAQLVETYGMEFIARGEISSVGNWLSSIPAGVLSGRPWLNILQAWVMVLSTRLDGIEAFLEAAETIPPASTSDRKLIPGHAAAIRAFAASKRNQTPVAVEMSRLALKKIPPDDSLVRGLVTYIFGMASLAEGDIVQACSALEEAGRLSQAAGSLHMAIPAYSALGVQQMILGKLHQAEEILLAALRLAELPTGNTNRQGGVLPLATRAYAELSRLHYEWNHPDTAIEHARKSVDSGKVWGNPEAMVRAYTALAISLQAQRQLDEAYTCLQQADLLIRERQLSAWSTSEVNSCRIRLWLDPIQGNLSAAAAWLDANLNLARKSPELPYILEVEQIALARGLIMTGRFDDAISLLERLAIAARGGSRFGRLIQILALQAAAFAEKLNHESAFKAILEAFTHGAAEGFVQSFLDAGAPLAEILLQVQPRLSPVHAAYSRSLLSAFGVPTPDESASNSGLGESLTIREQEILRMVANGLSNNEIAGALIIEISTVKRHINHIFSKLGVSSRPQAMVKARQLKLV